MNTSLLTRYEPESLLAHWFRPFEDLTDFLVNRPDHSLGYDLHETDQAYVISVDLPGVQPADLQLNCQEGLIVLSGERKQMLQKLGAENGSITRRFEKRFALPKNIQLDKIAAHYEAGVLNLVLPKVTPKPLNRIEISTGEESKARVLEYLKPHSVH